MNKSVFLLNGYSEAAVANCCHRTSRIPGTLPGTPYRIPRHNILLYNLNSPPNSRPRALVLLQSDRFVASSAVQSTASTSYESCFVLRTKDLKEREGEVESTVNDTLCLFVCSLIQIYGIINMYEVLRTKYLQDREGEVESTVNDTYP